jgi:hypothetical protein
MNSVVTLQVEFRDRKTTLRPSGRKTINSILHSILELLDQMRVKWHTKPRGKNRAQKMLQMVEILKNKDTNNEVTSYRVSDERIKVGTVEFNSKEQYIHMYMHVGTYICTSVCMVNGSISNTHFIASNNRLLLEKETGKVMKGLI